MKVQKGILPDSDRPVWIVLNDDYLPIEPIQKYLHYLDSVGRSPNTIHTYAHNLKLFWEFLRDSKLLEFRLRKDKTVQQKESDAHQCADWKIQLFKLAEVAFECEL